VSGESWRNRIRSIPEYGPEKHPKGRPHAEHALALHHRQVLLAHALLHTVIARLMKMRTRRAEGVDAARRDGARAQAAGTAVPLQHPTSAGSFRAQCSPPRRSAFPCFNHHSKVSYS
jgi:hypothetical protein